MTLPAPPTDRPTPSSAVSPPISHSGSSRWWFGGLLLTGVMAGLSGASVGLAVRLLPTPPTLGDLPGGLNLQVGNEQSFPPSDHWPAAETDTDETSSLLEDTVVSRDRLGPVPMPRSLHQFEPTDAAPDLASEAESAFPPPPIVDTSDVTADAPPTVKSPPSDSPAPLPRQSSLEAPEPPPASAPDPGPLDSTEATFTPLPLEPAAPAAPAAPPITVETLPSGAPKLDAPAPPPPLAVPPAEQEAL